MSSQGSTSSSESRPNSAEPPTTASKADPKFQLCVNLQRESHHFARVAESLSEQRKARDTSTCDLRIDLKNGFEIVHSTAMVAHSAKISQHVRGQKRPFPPLGMRNFHPTSVRSVLKWIYTGEAEFSINFLHEDFEVTSFLKVSFLQRQLELALRQLAEKQPILALNIAGRNLKNSQVRVLELVLPCISEGTVVFLVRVIHARRLQVAYDEVLGLTPSALCVALCVSLPTAVKVDLINFALRWLRETDASEATMLLLVRHITVGTMTLDALEGLRNSLCVLNSGVSRQLLVEANDQGEVVVVAEELLSSQRSFVVVDTMTRSRSTESSESGEGSTDDLHRRSSVQPSGLSNRRGEKRFPFLATRQANSEKAAERTAKQSKIGELKLPESVSGLEASLPEVQLQNDVQRETTTKAEEEQKSPVQTPPISQLEPNDPQVPYTGSEIEFLNNLGNNVDSKDESKPGDVHQKLHVMSQGHLATRSAVDETKILADSSSSGMAPEKSVPNSETTSEKFKRIYYTPSEATFIRNLPSFRSPATTPSNGCRQEEFAFLAPGASMPDSADFVVSPTSQESEHCQSPSFPLYVPPVRTKSENADLIALPNKFGTAKRVGFLIFDVLHL